MDMPKQYAPFAVAAVVAIVGFFLGDWSLMAWLLAAAIACAGVVLDNTRWGILATSVLGLGASAYLFSRKLESATGPALCNVNEVINCDVVNNSPESMLFGVPIALYGMGFFLGMAIAAVAARDASARLFPTSALLASVGVLYSAYLAIVAVKIGAVCVMCITIYLCTGLLLWAGLRGTAAEGTSLGDALPRVPTSQTFLTVSGTLLLVVVVGMSSWSVAEPGDELLPEITGEAPTAPAPSSPDHGGDGDGPADATAAGERSDPTDALDQDLREKLATLYAVARGPVQLSGNEPVLGDPQAPYLLVEFADFGCPHCAEASQVLKQLVRQEPSIQVRFRPFPLSGACNPALEGTERVDRCRAAVAAECAVEQGKFWDFSGAVFENYHDLSDEALTTAAAKAGLDRNAWLACMQKRETVERVMASAVAGARAGVMGTPTMYLKGVKGDDWLDVCAGPEAVLALVQMHQKGVELPAPANATCY